MSSRRALLTSCTLSAVPTLLFLIAFEKVSLFGVLILSILINWPIIRWLDDRQWYKEWKKD